MSEEHRRDFEVIDHRFEKIDLHFDPIEYNALLAIALADNPSVKRLARIRHHLQKHAEIGGEG